MQRLLWLPRVVLVCAYVGATTASHGPKPANLPCQLLLYPRYHLDHSSLLARHPLPQVSSFLLHIPCDGMVCNTPKACGNCCVNGFWPVPSYQVFCSTRSRKPGPLTTCDVTSRRITCCSCILTQTSEHILCTVTVKQTSLHYINAEAAGAWCACACAELEP